MLFRKILVAYDASVPGRKALEKAIELAAERPNAEIDVLYVSNVPNAWYPEMPYGSMYELEKETAQATIREAEKRLQGVPNRWRTLLAEGRPAKAIVDYAIDGGFDLIVMGSRGRSGLSELFLGSVSHGVVQHSPIPVLIMKGSYDEERTDPEPAGKIVESAAN